MGGRQTIETGSGGNEYGYSSETPENGGVITSLMDVYNNNIWLVETIARAAADNKWPRVDVKAGPVAPGVNGGFQSKVKSPMNKGREYELPGIGLAGDWPGGWTQTYAQVDTEAGAHGFDKDYFVQQVAGLSQITGGLMQVDPKVIDLTWGKLRSSLLNLKDSGFASPKDVVDHRRRLLEQYLAAFRQAEKHAMGKARSLLKELATSVATRVAPDQHAPIGKLLDEQLAKLT